MKNDEHTFYKIEDYLMGKLPPAEVDAFEQEIAADPELAETVEIQRIEREGLLYMMGEDLRAKLKQWETSPPPPFGEPEPQPSKRRWWLGGLAVAFIGVALVVWQLTGSVGPTEVPAQPPKEHTSPPAQQTETPSPVANEETTPSTKQPQADRYDRAQLATLSTAEYGNKLPSHIFPDNVKSDGTAAESPLSPAVATLSQPKPDFKKAIGELLKISPQAYPNEYGKAQEMLAHVYFNDRQFPKAAAIFQKMIDKGLSPAEKDQTEWYLLLSLLPDYESQKKRVDKLLEGMTGQNSTHEFADAAAEVKKGLAKAHR